MASPAFLDEIDIPLHRFPSGRFIEEDDSEPYRASAWDDSGVFAWLSGPSGPFFVGKKRDLWKGADIRLSDSQTTDIR